MRGIAAASVLLLVFVTTADARPKPKKRLAANLPPIERPEPEPAPIDDVYPTDFPTDETKADPVPAPRPVVRERERPKQRTRGQSIGTPWEGELRRATRMKPMEGIFLRRTHRVFGTRTTVEHTRRAIADTREIRPGLHALAIGDFSAESGGFISEHSSHQSGRDVDIGLYYKKKPHGYPASFIDADDDTLHAGAMWTLIAQLASTEKRDGGVKVMFLDFELQRVIYEWALEHEVPQKRLDRIFQYPHGRGASAGMVRHEPNHKNHVHVRYKCADADTDCR